MNHQVHEVQEEKYINNLRDLRVLCGKYQSFKLMEGMD